MALDSSTKKAYKEGIYTLFETLGTQVEFYFKNTSPSNLDIYGDPIVEENVDVFLLTATIKHKNLDYNDFDFKKQGHTEEATIEIPLYEIEKQGLDPYSMDAGVFVYGNRQYEVMYVQPKGLFAQMYTSFEFACKGVSSV